MLCYATYGGIITEIRKTDTNTHPMHIIANDTDKDPPLVYSRISISLSSLQSSLATE